MTITRNRFDPYWRPPAERFDGSSVAPEGGDWFDSPYGDEDPADLEPPHLVALPMGRFVPVTQDGDVKNVAPAPHPAGRTCAACPTVLSVYNAGPLCEPHAGLRGESARKLA